MKLTDKVSASTILAFVSGSALYGGWMLMVEPSGAGLGMSVEALAASPFYNYTIPGMTLFLIIGCGGLAVLITVLFRKKPSRNLFIFSGLTLGGWIIIQMIMIQRLDVLHTVCLLAGLILATNGAKKRK